MFFWLEVLRKSLLFEFLVWGSFWGVWVFLRLFISFGYRVWMIEVVDSRWLRGGRFMSVVLIRLELKGLSVRLSLRR